MFEEELRKLESEGLLRHIADRSSPQGPVVRIGGRSYINFSSNDYLGLAGRPEMVGAVGDSVKRWGFGSGASRLLAGGSLLHERLEREISKFKGTDSAIVFNSGYAANTGILPALSSEDDVIMSDELNHASIIDGCRLSRAKTLVYRHRDVDHLEKLLKKADRRGKKIVATDTVFSMAGDIAPLRDIAEVCLRHDAVLYIDDAHATGVLGKGRGGLAHFGIEPAPWIIQMGTFSKALGSFGAFAAGSGDAIRWISNKARSFIFSTALPSCVVSASLASMRVLRSRPALVTKLWCNRENLAEALTALGYDIGESATPILPLKAGELKDTIKLAEFLRGKGVLAPAIRPPTVREPRLRITVSAAHEEKHIARLLEALRTFRNKMV
jgi:8-amino-7-oxononanoate synthase